MQKEVVFAYKSVGSHRLSAARWPNTLLHTDFGEGFLQRSTRHVRRRDEPRAVEEADMILGVPKIVWVILCDVIAL